MCDRLIHTQYKTAAAKWHHIKSRIKYRMTDTTDHEAEMKYVGEYSGRTPHSQKMSEKREGVVSKFYYSKGTIIRFSSIKSN